MMSLDDFSVVEQLSDLPRSALTIFQVLQVRGALKSEVISQETNLSARTVRYGLKKLLDCKVVVKLPDFTDLRSSYYQVLSSNFRKSTLSSQ